MPKTKMQKHLQRAVTTDLCCALFALVPAVAALANMPDKESPPETPIGVCDLLKDVEHYRGKMIAVRGIYWYGLREPCRSPIIAADRQWPSAVNLIDVRGAVTGGFAVDFQTDQRSWDALDMFVAREAKAGHREQIWVTVIGLLQSPDPSSGRILGGYGHLGAYPAQLVVKRVSDIKVKAEPTYDYRQLLKSKGR